ncbi:MAG TPA: lipopolysaccharide biosynthesis protein [Methylomirabilota bacterium]|nr:lipopolysaccharide biosynthesis protein [Methylomirabilota bacterium]
MNRLLPVILGQLSTLLIGLISVKLLSALVPPTVNGAYSLFLSFAQIGVLITHAGVINHSSRFWHRERHRPEAYAAFLWRESWLRAPLLLCVLAGATICYSLKTADHAFLLGAPMMAAGAFALAITEIVALGENAREHHWNVLKLRLGASILRTFAPLAAVLLFAPSFSALIGAFGVQSVVAVVACGFFWRRSSLPADQQTHDWKKELNEYGRPFLFLGIGSWLLSYSDRWALSISHTNATVGLFALASNLAAVPATFVLSLLMQWRFPHIFRASDSAKTKSHWEGIARSCDQTTIQFLLLSVAAVGALHLMGPHLVGWLVGERYEPSMGLLLAAGFSTISAQVCQFQYLLLQGQRKSREMVWVMAALAFTKSIGACVAASFSLEAFKWWLIASPFVLLAVGRQLIRKAAFKGL